MAAGYCLAEPHVAVRQVNPGANDEESRPPAIVSITTSSTLKASGTISPNPHHSSENVSDPFDLRHAGSTIKGGDPLFYRLKRLTNETFTSVHAALCNRSSP